MKEFFLRTHVAAGGTKAEAEVLWGRRMQAAYQRAVNPPSLLEAVGNAAESLALRPEVRL